MWAKGGWRFWAFAVMLPSAVLGVLAGAVITVWLVRTPGTDPTAPAAAAAPLRPEAQQRAVQVIERAARGHYTDALALAAPDRLDQELLRKRIGEFAPTVRAASPLPNGQTLVWVTYERDGKRLTAHYLVTDSDAGLTAVDGPFAPWSGYRTFNLDAFAEDGTLIRASGLKEKGMILVAPRRPDPDLPPLLEILRQEAERWGAQFILAIDTAAPDWGDYARAEGYNGTIWRLKGNLETLPTISAVSFRGTIGVLVDRSGTVVAPLSVLDPVRYGRADEEITEILPAVLKAYGLIP